MPDWLTSGEETVGATGTFSHTGQPIEGVLWTDCRLIGTRLTASTFTGCQFQRVEFDDCDLSSVTFIDCLFSHCVIRGGKCGAFLAFVDALVGDLAVEQVRADSIEFQGCRLRRLTISDSDIASLTFSQPVKPGRAGGTVTITDTEIGAIGGFEKLSSFDVSFRTDQILWPLLGDLLLRQLGISRVDDEHPIQIGVDRVWPS